MDCKFIEAEHVIYRLNDEGTSLHVKLITDNTVMYKDMTLDEMKRLRDFLDKQIVKMEGFWQRAGSL